VARTSYSDAIADEICRRLSEGESLRSICRDDHMPDRQTVLNWQNNRPEFSAKCARARDAQADWLQDDMADIERDVLTGALDPQAARVVLSSKQWRASKLAPKKYGDRQHLEHTGAEGSPLIPVLNVTISKPRS
jgi:hypothetical protein